MKLHELSRTIKQLLIITRSILRPPSIGSLEFDYTIRKLEKLLDDNMIAQDCTAETLQPFRHFLAFRWSLIKSTDIIYPHNIGCSLNRICIILASNIAPYYKLSIMQLLMPSVELITNDITGTTFDDQLNFHEFILSKNNKRFIEVGTCIEYAENDGILKHTSLFDGEQMALLPEEIALITSHSIEAKNYYKCIRNLVQVRNYGTKVGAMLRQLIRNLRGGGVRGHNGGSEYNAGGDANIGILVFNEYLQTCSQEVKGKLFKCTAGPGGKTFDELWGRLARPNDANYRSVVFCVEIIASTLETLLEHNKFLDNLSPTGEVKHEPIAVLENRCKKAKEEFEKAFASEHYSLSVTYGNEAKQRRTLIQNMCIALEWNEFINEVGELNAVENLNDYRFIGEVLDNMPEEFQWGFINNIVNSFDIEFLQHVIDSSDKLGYLIDRFSVSIGYSFLLYLDEHAVSLIQSPEELGFILCRIPESKRLSYLALMQDRLFEIMPDGMGLGLIFEVIPTQDWRDLINKCTGEQPFKGLLSQPNVLEDILARISAQNLQHFLDLMVIMYGQNILKTIFKDCENKLLCKTMKRLDQQDQLRLLRLLQPNFSHFFSSISAINHLTTQLDANNQCLFLKMLLNSNLLLRLISDINTFISIITPVTLTKRFEALKLLPIKLLYTTFYNVETLLRLLPLIDEQDKLPLLELLGKDYLASLCKMAAHLGSLIAHFPPNARENLLRIISLDHLSKLIVNVDQLEKILIMLNPAERLDFIKLLAEKRLVDLKEIMYSIVFQLNGIRLIKLMPATDQLAYANLLKHLVAPTSIRTLIGCNDITALIIFVVNNIDLDQRSAFYMEIVGVTDLVFLVKNIHDLITLLNAAPVTCWAEIVLALEDRMKFLIPSMKEFAIFVKEIRKINTEMHMDYKLAIINNIFSFLIKDAASVIGLLEAMLVADRIWLINTVGVQKFIFNFKDLAQLKSMILSLPEIFRTNVIASLSVEHVGRMFNNQRNGPSLYPMLSSSHEADALSIQSLICALFLSIIAHLQYNDREIFIKFFEQEQLQFFIQSSEDFYHVVNWIKPEGRVGENRNQNALEYLVSSLDPNWLCSIVVTNYKGLKRFLLECGLNFLSSLPINYLAQMMQDLSCFVDFIVYLKDLNPQFNINETKKIITQIFNLLINGSSNNIIRLLKIIRDPSLTWLIHLVGINSFVYKYANLNVLKDVLSLLPLGFRSAIISALRNEEIEKLLEHHLKLINDYPRLRIDQTSADMRDQMDITAKIAAIISLLKLSDRAIFIKLFNKEQLKKIIEFPSQFYRVVFSLKSSVTVDDKDPNQTSLNAFIAMIDPDWICKKIVINMAGLKMFSKECGCECLSSLNVNNIVQMITSKSLNFGEMVQANNNEISPSFIMDIIRVANKDLLCQWISDYSILRDVLNKITARNHAMFITKIGGEFAWRAILDSQDQLSYDVNDQNIMANITTAQLQSRRLTVDQLGRFLIRIPRNRWSNFLQKFGNEHLATTVFMSRSLGDIVKLIDIYKSNSMQYKALLFCAYQVYGFQRGNNQSEYTTPFGYLFGHPLNKKVNAALAGQQAIVDNRTLDDPTLDDHRKALTSGDLDLITGRAFGNKSK